jgi:hypothetical protein
LKAATSSERAAGQESVAEASVGMWPVSPLISLISDFNSSRITTIEEKRSRGLLAMARINHHLQLLRRIDNQGRRSDMAGR